MLCPDCHRPWDRLEGSCRIGSGTRLAGVWGRCLHHRQVAHPWGGGGCSCPAHSWSIHNKSSYWRWEKVGANTRSVGQRPNSTLCSSLSQPPPCGLVKWGAEKESQQHGLCFAGEQLPVQVNRILLSNVQHVNRYPSRPAPTNTHLNNSSPKPYPPPARCPSLAFPPHILHSGKQAKLLVPSSSSDQRLRVSHNNQIGNCPGGGESPEVIGRSAKRMEFEARGEMEERLQRRRSSNLSIRWDPGKQCFILTYVKTKTDCTTLKSHHNSILILNFMHKIKKCLGKPSIKKRFFVKSLHKMVTPPRPPFMKSLFIFFPSIFWAKKRDDFEGCLKGVDGCFKGVWRVLQGVWRVFGKIK